MNPFDNAFERKWTLIFLFEFFFIMMPFPWFYDLEYTPWLFGVPRFIYCWLAYGLLVIGTIALWWRSCMKRPEYQASRIPGIRGLASCRIKLKHPPFPF